MTKAGPVNVFYNPFRMVAACAVPHNVHLHQQRINMSAILTRQPQIQIVPTFDKLKDKTFPIVSGVRGMTFALIDLSDAPDVLGALKPSEIPDYEIDGDWSPSFKGAFYYVQKESMSQNNEPTIHSIQARMIIDHVEDPGTGSASCALACYLATNQFEDLKYVKQENEEDELAQRTGEVKLDESAEKSIERHVYAIQQGVEMNRTCTIAVEVDLKTNPDGSKTIVNVTLSGRARFFARGELDAHP